MLSNAMEWIISFKDISYEFPEKNRIKMDKFLQLQFNFDLDYYFVTKVYFDSIKSTFFETYLSQGICKIQKLTEFYLRYQFIICDKSFNKEISKFPTLNFVNEVYNFTFELTYNDCFKEVNGKVLFLLFYDPWSPDVFKAGKKFMQKYQFIFKKDQKNVGFLNFKDDSGSGGGTKDRNNKDGQKKFEMKQLLWVVILLVLFVGIIIGIIVGKKIWDKNRKKRANELTDDDEYVYEPAKNELTNQIIN